MSNDSKKEDIRITERRTSFHNWKHENPITKDIFSYLNEISERLVTRIIKNALSPSIPQELKLMTYYACAAKLETIQELINISLDNDDFQQSILKRNNQ